MNKKAVLLSVAVLALVYLMPELASASVESTLSTIQDRLVSTILPLVSVLGFVFAGLAYVSGSPNARQYLIYAVIGAIVGFGAQSFVTFIRSMVN